MKIRLWFRRLAGALVLLFTLSYVFSLSLRAGRIHRYLERRLASSFGRPVEVGRFGFSLFAGPRLEAERVSVSEDPAFGYEYFLRAERLAAGPRWSQLVRGRFEFGTLSFTRPSLNLVRDSDGRWNVERWLPPRTSGPSPADAAGAGRLYRIEFDTGRINLKDGMTKQPFALVDVSGTVEQETRGRWRLDLRAQPARAGVTLQDIGLLRLRGRIAGTSTRLQPAELFFEWEQASLADLLRLVRGRDFGVRGHCGAELTARTAPAEQPRGAPANWTFGLRARVSGVHRWDFAERPDNPALNLTVDAAWNPAQARLDLTQVLLEAPHSQVRAAGEVTFTPLLEPRLRWDSAGIHLGGLLAWLRAFHAGVADGLTADGYISGSAETRGWPPKLETAQLESRGGTLSAWGTGPSIRWGHMEARGSENRLRVSPVVISFARAADSRPPLKRGQTKESASPDSLSIGLSLDLTKRTTATVLTGHIPRAEDILALAASLGWKFNRGWELHGPAHVDLRVTRDPRGAWAAEGPVHLRNAQLHMAGLNSPVEVGAMELSWPGGRPQAVIKEASAFGANWTGTISGPNPAGAASPPEWRFQLRADHLSAAELDRWLGPRARPGWLERLLPGLLGSERGSTPAAPRPLLHNLHARGELAVDQFSLGALKLERLRAQTVIASSKVSVSAAEAEFAGGRVKGSLEASFSLVPRYEARIALQRVDLAALAEASPALRSLVAGQASGQINLTARGIGRAELLGSLEGKGSVRLRSAEFRGLDLPASFSDGVRRSGRSRWTAGQADFSVARRAVQMNSLRFENGQSAVLVNGTVDFGRVADLRVELLPSRDGAPPGVRSLRPLRLAGPLEALRVTSEGRRPVAAQVN
jgi:hypothetical protein